MKRKLQKIFVKGKTSFLKRIKPVLIIFLLLFAAINLSAQVNLPPINQQFVTCLPTTLIDVVNSNAIVPCAPIDVTVIVTPTTTANATVSLSGDNILYTPLPDFIGRDTISFAILCEETIYDGKVIIIVVECPDNIDTADCVGAPPATVWGISEDYLKSTVTVNSYGQPYVGDVDGCGKNEVVIWNNGGAGEGRGDAILIFNDDLTVKYEIPVGGISATYHQSPDLALAFAKTNTAHTAADIFAVVGNSVTTSILKCFSFDGDKWDEKWAATATGAGVSYSAAINIGDINNDGTVMLYVDNKIFNANDGKLLLILPTAPKGKQNGTAPIMNLLADMDNDGTLEAVTGTCVYKLNITNLAGETGNSYIPLYELPSSLYPTSIHADGLVSVADVNLDGYLDVIVSTNRADRPVILVWNTQTVPPSLIGEPIIVPSTSTTNTQASRVFIGDVDGDGYPELAVVNYNRISCFKLNTTTNDFDVLWSSVIHDGSQETYVSMFDFNQDGKPEIVYRDEQYLHIIDGESGSTNTKISCFSPTLWEGAIIADLNGDGHAQILVTGNEISTNTYNQTYLRVYTSSIPGAWAPARQVWNQYSYNALNINEDLTVPQFQMNPSTVFPNGKRPYNNFLTQQTLLNKNGDPLWLLPNIVWTTPPSTTLAGDSLVFTGCITNTGDASLQAPIFVTLYKNDTLSLGNIISFDSIPVSLMPDSAYCFSLTLKNACSFLPSTDIWISINDRNGVYPYQNQCEIAGRRKVTVTGVVPSVGIVGKDTICAGATTQLSPATGGTWKSNAPAIAMVTNNGVITGISSGIVTFTFTDTVTGCIATTDILTVMPTPNAPFIIITPLPADAGMPIDLSLAVDILPGLIYTYYENLDKTGPLTGNVITFYPPKNDYYVTVSNEDCEGPISKIMLHSPCPLTVRDEEGNTYKVISLAGYCWTENLKTTIYPGTNTPIPFANPYTCLGCPSQLDTIFGLLYTWHSAVGADTLPTTSPVQGICPAGYHIPSLEVWSALDIFAAEQLKSTLFWIYPLGNGTDDFGFNALPAGWFNGATNRCEELYGFAGWWASNSTATQTASDFSIHYHCDTPIPGVKHKNNGLSVRCVKDY